MANENRIDPDAGVTPPEDLMREHGVLNRCLLVYEEGIRRLRAGDDLTPQVFHHTATLVRRFVEDYHERNEERHIFPLFKDARRAQAPPRMLLQARGVDFVQLVNTLKSQYDAGRVLTRPILTLSASPDVFHRPENTARVIENAEQFLRMYRPHESWEGTVLFPAIRTVLTPKQAEALGERMEEEEHKILGDEGYEKAVVDVASIEKALGIYDLRQFTPKT